MSGVPIYTRSPISAAAASAAPPPTSAAAAPAAETRASTTSTSTPSTSTYPAAQPGAVAGPAPTAPASLLPGAHPPPFHPSTPTATTALPSDGPPLPQPGAFPAPTGTSHASLPSHTGIPPPPKAGEARRSSGDHVPSQSPPQMHLGSPNAGTRAGRFTTTSTVPSGIYLPPHHLATDDTGPPRRSLEHPPGYVQNPQAGEVAAAQGLSPPVNQSGGLGYGGASHGGKTGNVFDVGAGEGVWDTAKKWAKVAGEKASEAEKEVWRRINKE